MNALLSLLSIALLCSIPRAQAPTPVLPRQPGAWISDVELAELPTSGSAWDRLRADADRSLSYRLGDQDSKGDSYVFAAALVARRLELAGDLAAAGYRARAQAALALAPSDTSSDGTSLPWSRNVCSIALAADILDYHEPGFEAWLYGALSFEHEDGRSIRSTHEDRPNNWGTHAGASRAAIAVYFDDQVELAECARVFKGYLGDRASYDGFSFGELSWQADEAHPVGVNPLGARKSGVSLGGALPEEMRRCGDFPEDLGCQTNYTWEAMQGVLVQAIILWRQGYDTWRWERFAVGRAAYWAAHWNQQPPDAAVNSSDDRWQAYVLRRAYPVLARDIALVSPAPHGKHVGYTDWTTSGTKWP